MPSIVSPKDSLGIWRCYLASCLRNSDDEFVATASVHAQSDILEKFTTTTWSKSIQVRCLSRIHWYRRSEMFADQRGRGKNSATTS